MAETELPPTLVVELLESLLGTNDNSLQTIVNSAPISSLIDNLLQQQLSARQHSTIDSAPSDHPLDPARSLLLQLFLRLANFSGTISLPRFALILAVYGPTNRSIIQGFVERVFDHDERLLLHLGEKGPKLFAATAALPGPHSVEQLHQIVAIHCALAADSHPTVTSEYGQNQSVYSTLSHFYAQLDLSDLLSLPTATIKSSSDASIRIRTKAQLLETFHHLLDVSFLTPLQDSTTTTDDKAGFVMELDEMLAELLSAAAKEKAGNEDKTFFCNASLLRDLEFYYDISGTLESSLGRNLDRMGRDVLGRFKSLVGSSDPNDGYEILLGTRPAQRPNGKSPEVVDNSSSLDDLTPAITQILDLFPNHDAAFITRCLLHPRFDRSAELVIAALLEDDLPSELREDYSVRVEDEEATPVPAAITRRNVFDDEKIDMAKLTRGKATKSSADTLLSDKQFMTDSIKAAIIARAEAESSDEEGEEGEAFLEDFDDGRVAFKVRDDNDENEESVEEVLKPVALPPTTAPANPITPALEYDLQAIYIATPGIFDNTSVMRRSKARIDLRAKTGLDDQQLEGWRIMMERNPKKSKILSQHEFGGNHRPPPFSDGTQPQTGPKEKGGEGGGGRGGRGGARGGRGRGRGDGGKSVSNRQQRGADRKLAKVA